MSKEKTISWIYLSLALASEVESADFNGISSIADGINHAIPTHYELQTSISWLTSQGLVEKHENKYILSLKGKQEFEKASKETKTLFSMWNYIEKTIKL
jgi:hypothetical protein